MRDEPHETSHKKEERPDGDKQRNTSRRAMSMNATKKTIVVDSILWAAMAPR